MSITLADIDRDDAVGDAFSMLCLGIASGRIDVDVVCRWVRDTNPPTDARELMSAALEERRLGNFLRRLEENGG